MKNITDSIPGIVPQCVEVGASGGGSGNYTYDLLCAGWKTLWIEFDAAKYNNFANSGLANLVSLLRKITPDNIVQSLNEAGISKDFGCMVLDIDGYDYFVLRAMLKGGYRPSVLMCEFNEKIPHPIKFTVQYEKDYVWHVDHLWGMSIALLEEVAKEYQYDMVQMCAPDVILVAREKNTFPVRTAKQLYDEYKVSGLALSPTSYNANVRHWLTMPPDECVEDIKRFFATNKKEFAVWM